MKLILALSFILSSSVFAETRVLKNISICAVKCQSLGMNHLNHDMAQTGELFIADYSAENSTSTGLCLEAGGEGSVPLAGDRGIGETRVGITTKECVKIIEGKYYGKNVTIETENFEGHDERYVTKIYPTKK